MKVAIIGTAGIPARYGGFETLAANLVDFNRTALRGEHEMLVVCSGRAANQLYPGAKLRFVPLRANGWQSVFYDGMSLMIALRERCDVVLILGVSGAVFLPLVRLRGLKSVTNIDGIEWRREKWGPIARAFLWFSERLALSFSDAVIADNAAILEYLKTFVSAEKSVTLIAYGGDHAVRAEHDVPLVNGSYCLALCRVEPENNVEMILEAFSRLPNKKLVFVGNWASSRYGVELRSRFSRYSNLCLFDPIYQKEDLVSLRANAEAYIHGHSAGGTNPSLVEAMHFGMPIFAFDCSYNRCTMSGLGRYFESADALCCELAAFVVGDSDGAALQALAQREYCWRAIGQQYFDLLERTANRD